MGSLFGGIVAYSWAKWTQIKYEGDTWKTNLKVKTAISPKPRSNNSISRCNQADRCVSQSSACVSLSQTAMTRGNGLTCDQAKRVLRVCGCELTYCDCTPCFTLHPVPLISLLRRVSPTLHHTASLCSSLTVSPSSVFIFSSPNVPQWLCIGLK